MTDPNDNLPLGRPQQVPLSTGIEAEERALQKGKGKMIAFAVLVVLAAGGGLVAFMAMGQSDELYSELGKNLNAADRDHFTRFWGCAFQGVVQIRNNQDIEYQIHKRARAGGRRYAKVISTQCMPMIEPMRTRLDGTIAPPELQPQVRQLANDIGALQSAWSEFIAHLDTGDYDQEDDSSIAYVRKIAKGWYDYKIHRSSLGKAINAKRLGH